ncbi:MAG: PP2C family protein-serine/threonine phosphatase, partial [Bacteroidia bacterium]
MLRFFKNILNNGLHDGLNFSEKNKLRVFNPACVFVMVMGLAYAVVGFLIHFPVVAFASLGSAVFSVVAMYFVSIRKYSLSFHFMMIFGLFYIAMFVIAFGLKINTYLFLLFMPVACNILFDSLSITVKYFAAILAMIVFLIYYSNGHAAIYSNELLNGYAFSISNTLLSATLIFLGVRSFKTENITYSKQLEHKNELIEEKNKNITDSINYARRIQYTLLAHDAFLKQHLPEHFILFKPKDIVSGDFYWATVREELGDQRSEKLQGTSPNPGPRTQNVYLAVCDSTGHGVPGAFMSLLNSSFLNEAINEKNIREPHEVLNHVRQRLIESISQDGGKDGMDGILVRFEPGAGPQLSTVITYSAANNGPIIIRNNAILELPKDKMPVGQGEKADSFTLHTITGQPGDMLYLY